MTDVYLGTICDPCITASYLMMACEALKRARCQADGLDKASVAEIRIYERAIKRMILDLTE